MNSSFPRRIALAFLLVSFSLRSGGAADFVVLDDFESGTTTNWTAVNVTARRVSVARGDTLSGGAALELAGFKDGSFVHRAVATHDWRRFGALSLHAAVEAAAPVELRVVALEGNGPRAWTARLRLNPGGWREVLLPLARFRWDNDQVADFGRIDRVALRWERGAGAVQLDDLRLLPGSRGEGSARLSLDERMTLAFPAGGGEAFESEHFVVLTDVPKLQTRDTRKLLKRLEEGLQLLHDRYGVGGELEEKVAFHVFRTRPAYRGFFQRLGDHYQATIALPTSDGYSVLDTSASFYDPAQGWDRPVYVHEVMHPVLCQLLRLPTNGNWLQEALAACVQAALHPKTLSRPRVADSFAKLATGQAGEFVPWEKLFAMPRPPTGRYGELVSIIEFLREQHRDALPKIWTAVREQPSGAKPMTINTIAGLLKQDVQAMEQSWLVWGQTFFRK